MKRIAPYTIVATKEELSIFFPKSVIDRLPKGERKYGFGAFNIPRFSRFPCPIYQAFDGDYHYFVGINFDKYDIYCDQLPIESEEELPIPVKERELVPA
jgi:hypothetical protein